MRITVLFEVIWGLKNMEGDVKKKKRRNSCFRSYTFLDKSTLGNSCLNAMCQTSFSLSDFACCCYVEFVEFKVEGFAKIFSGLFSLKTFTSFPPAFNGTM